MRPLAAAPEPANRAGSNRLRGSVLSAVAIACAGASASFASTAFAAIAETQDGTSAPNPGSAESTAAVTSSQTTLKSVEVNARIDQARNRLTPETGASQYVIDKQGIDQLPLGAASPLNQVLLQAPGVVQDSYGQLHIRGDHADLQYRINGVIIPESISGFGQTLDTRIVDNVQLLTGALPAQYGYRTAGIVEIATKIPEHPIGGSIGAMLGSAGTFSPELSLYGSNGDWNYLLSGSFLQNDIGIENPTASYNALHDHSDQLKLFGDVGYLIDADTRVTFMFGVTNNRFEIPNNPGQAPTFDLANVDLSSIDSADLDARQREKTRFGVLAIQGKLDTTDYQVSIGQRYTGVGYQPDAIGDLVFNGVAGTIARSNRANTLQADFSTPVAGGTHTVRYGLYASLEQPISNATSVVFPADENGNQTSTTTLTIVDDAPHIHARTLGAYVQDEWNLNDALTLNYGLRADQVNAYVNESQLSPRIGLVYQLNDSTALHAGYSRYFTPPPTELISPTDIAKFQGTTNALPTGVNAQTLSERSDYFDAGISQKFGSVLTLGLDAYYRKVHNLLDEGQFGAALIFSPFNYAQGRIRGIELSSNYTSGHFRMYANASFNRAMGREVVTGQYNFSADELAYIADHWVHLDHDQRLTGSGGASYEWSGTRWGVDFLYGSGLRADFANTAHLPQYWQINLSAARDVELPQLGVVNLHVALINATDKVYEIRDGSGIGVGAPQYGPRAGVFLGLSKAF